MIGEICDICPGFKHWIQENHETLSNAFQDIVGDERKMEREYYLALKRAKNRLDRVYCANLS